MANIKLLDKNIELVIFDMDGTLIDSVGIWEDIDVEFFAKRGFDHVPDEYQEMIIHTGLEKGAQLTIEKYGFINDTVESVIEEWKDASYKHYAYKIPLKPFAKEILEQFKNKGVYIALATANDKALYEPCLERLGIKDYFDLIVDVDSVKAGKSSPKIFDYISEHFNVKPENSLVVEDSLMGITTASNAGYNVVGVDDKSSRKSENEKKDKSLIYIYSFDELINMIK